MKSRIITPKGHALGWRKDSLDHRDLLYAAPLEIQTKLPDHVDLRAGCPPVYDQAQLGSCTANAIAGAVQFDRMRQKLINANRVPSRLMVYYDERVIEGSVDSDAGAEIRDGIKSMATTGTCFEDGSDSWPYNISKFTQKPPQPCYDAALKDRAIQYLKVNQLVQQMKSCLAQGFPFVFGFTVFDSFESDAVAQTGNVPMPASSEQVLGGHAVLCVGYRPDHHWIVRNSWSDGWGDKGYCYFPEAYLTRTDLSSDFWTIRLMSP